MAGQGGPQGPQRQRYIAQDIFGEAVMGAMVHLDGISSFGPTCSLVGARHGLGREHGRSLVDT